MRTSDVIVVCAADPRHFNRLVDWRARTNILYGARKLLLHRPLNFDSITRTLRQIHRDSEECLVDGWEIPADGPNEGREVRRCRNLVLKFASRTHSPVVSLLPPASGVWDLSALNTVCRLSSEFQDLKFIVLRSQDIFQMLTARYSYNASETIRSFMLSPNIYYCLEKLTVTVASGVDSTHTLWGQPYSPTARSFGGRSTRGRDYGFLGLNAAAVYSLHPHHYRTSLSEA